MPMLRKISMLEAEPDPDGRDPEAFVRFSRRRDRSHGMRLEVAIGRELWYRLGSPPRVTFAQYGDRIVITPANGSPGKKLHITNSSPRTWAPAKLSVEPGRYKAIIRYGRIIVGELDQDDHDEATTKGDAATANASAAQDSNGRADENSMQASTADVSTAAMRDAILTFVQEYYAQNEAGPTYREVQIAFGIRSRSSLWYHIQYLVSQKLVYVTPIRLQTIVPVETSNQQQALKPSTASESIQRTG